MNAVLEQINSTGKTFVEFAVPMLVQSGALIVILLLIDFVLRKKVKAVFRYCIWMLVLLKLILPTSLSSPLSLGYWFGDHLAYVAESRTSAAPEAEAEAEEPALADMLHIIEPVPVEEGRPTPAVLPMMPDVEPAVTEAVSPPAVSVTPVTWQGVVFLLWLAVVMALGLLLLQRAMFVRGLVAQAKEANALMNDALEYCCKCMGVKRKIGLKVSANAASPAVCGLFRPVILLPRKLAPSLGSRGLRAVLLHELAHIRRRDLWVNLIQTVLQIVYFYNPLLWLANCVIRRIREQAIDETVLVAMGEKAQQYPQTLVNVAKLAFKRPVLSLRLIGVVESKSALAGRIKHILNRPMPKSAKVGVLGLAAVLIIGAILLPMAKAEKQADMGTDVQAGSLEHFIGKYAMARHPDKAAFEITKKGDVFIVSDLGGPKFEMEEAEDGLKFADGGGERFLVWYDASKNVYYLDNLGIPGKEWEPESILLTKISAKQPEVKPAVQVEGENDGKKVSQFAATLPNGMTVELVGVCENPSVGKQWWRPDGIPMKKTPIDGDRGLRLTRGDDRLAREFAVRVLGSNAAPFPQRIEYEILPCYDHGLNGPLFKNGRPLSDMWVIGGSIPTPVSMCIVRIFVSGWCAEFKNVSLQPGIRTEVDVLVPGTKGEPVPADLAFRQAKAKDLSFGIGEGRTQMGAVRAWEELVKRGDISDEQRLFATWRMGCLLSCNFDSERGEHPDFQRSEKLLKKAMYLVPGLLSQETINSATLYATHPCSDLKRAERLVESYRFLKTVGEKQIRKSAERINKSGYTPDKKFFYGICRLPTPSLEERMKGLEYRVDDACRSLKENITGFFKYKKDEIAYSHLFSLLEGVADVEDLERWRNIVTTEHPAVQVEGEEVEPDNSEVTGAKERVPIHPWHKERVENIQAETIEQTIENLANFDDMLFATTVVSDLIFQWGEMRSSASVVVHLFRVRRLLEEGKEKPRVIVPLLRTTLKECLAVWPEVREQFIRLMGISDSFSEPTSCDKALVKALTATYLLAELQDHDSLPILVESYKLNSKWLNEREPHSFTPHVVPPPFTLYAIHRLARTLDPENMDQRARAARQVYMEWAQKNLPPPNVFTGTGWQSDYDESDPYRRIVDPEGEVLKYEPRIRLAWYPHGFRDGAYFQMSSMKEMRTTEREKEWADLLLQFVEVACKDKTDVQVEGEGSGKSSESKGVKPTVKEPSEHAGRISGVVVNSVTGQPIAGAYVGVGDFGDSGGSNYSRHRSQGFHDKTKTDENGRFELGGLAFTDDHPYLKDHPLVVTHPDFVRHDEKVKLLKDEPVPDIKVGLRPAARIDVTIVDADGNPLEGYWLLRLEALDGRRFIPPGGDPHLSSFASSIWAHWPDLRTKMGVSQGFTFNELDTGEYSVEAIRFHLVDNPTPQNIWKPTVTYHGSIPTIEIQAGQAKEVKLPPQDHQTLLTIIPPEFPDMLLGKLNRSLHMPLLCLISRSPGLLLWDDGKAHHLEDQRLGRIDKKRFFRGFFSQGRPLTIHNLPPGSYSLFVVAVYGEVAGCLIGARAELAKGDNVTVDIRWRQPQGPSMVGPNRAFDYPVKLEARDYSASELCELLTAITKSNPRIIADMSIENEMLKLGERQMSIWDVLEKLYLDKGWKLGEAPEKTLILEPEASSTAKKHRVYLPDLETPHANVILDLATGEMLQAMWLKNNKVAKLGKGDVVYEYSSNRSSLLCLRGATMQLRTNAGLSSLKVDIQREYFAGYLLKEVPCQYQVTTAEGDKYELKVISIDKGDAGGTFIEFWKSEKQKTDVQVEVERSDKSSESKSGSNDTLYGSVTGTVRFHGTDAPASGVVVKTISKWFDTVQARTDQQGSYTLAGIRPEAVFHITAEDEQKELFMIDMPAVVLKPGEAKTGVDLTLYQGRKGSISGKVVGRRIFYQKPERLTRNIVPENFERRQDSPLPGVKIVLKSNKGVLKETITDQKGRYRFEGLHADGYVVRAEQPAGTVAETVRTLPMAGPGRAEHHGSSQSRWVELISEPKTDVDFHFRLDWVSIAGRVTDADGNPVSGVKVGAELCSPKMDGGEGRSGAFSTIKISWGSVSMISGDDGRYRLDGLCPVTFSETATYLIHGKLYRRYEVRIQAKGYSPARVLVPPVTEHLVGETSRLMEDYKGLYGERDSSSAEADLPKSRGNAVTGIDFVMEKEAVITGRVLDTQGNIVPGPRPKAWVRLVPVDSRDDKNEKLLVQMPDRAGLDWIALDKVGRFRIDGVPAGSYFFKVDTKGHRYQKATNETLVVKAGEIIRDIEVIVPKAVSEGQKVVGTWEMVETNSDNAVAAILILKTDGTYFLEVGTASKGTTHAKASTYTVKDGQIQMSGAEWDSVSLEDNRVVIIADSTRTVFEKKDPLKKRTEIEPPCVGAWRVRDQSVVYVIDRSGSVKTYGDYVPEKSKSLITGKYSVVVYADLMEVWQMQEVDGNSSLEISLERIKIAPKFVGSWQTAEGTLDELGLDRTTISLDLHQDATFILKSEGPDAAKSIKGVYFTEDDTIQLLSDEKELSTIRFARYDNGTIHLAIIGHGIAVLSKQKDRTLNLEQAGKLQVYVTLNGKGQMAWSVSARPAGEGPDAEISTQMGKDGRYELTGLKQAEYLVRAPVPLSTGVRGRATVQINNRARVKIEPGKETRLDFELRDNAGIRGTFTCPDKDLSWRILIFDDSAAVRDDSVSEVRQAHALIWKLEQGKHYEITCLPAGTYRVVGRCCKKDQGWTPVMEKSKTVTVGAGETAEVDFVFP